MADTEEHLRNLLNKVAEEQNYENPEIIINEISSGGANYTSKLYTAIIRGKNKEDLNLFAKVAAVGEKFRSEIPFDFFGNERLAYTELLKTYAALEEEHGVPEEHRVLYTKCYGIDDTLYKETMVLENLAAQGYESCDRFKAVDWEYASAAFTECAKFHALSFAFRKHRPDEYDKVCRNLKATWEHLDVESIIGNSVKMGVNAIRPEHKKAFEKFMKNSPGQHLLKLLNPGRAEVIVHCDYRGSNLMHRVREDGKVDIKVLDLQTLQIGSPIADLIYFIFAGSDEKFRAKYFDKLFDHYYTQLSASMRRLNLNPDEIYSREDFYSDFKEKLPYGLTMALSSLAVVTIDTADAPAVDENLGIDSFTEMKTSDLYIERLNGVVNDYVKWGILY
uniref:CHK kinase-like domain-containing protein n=1 Tax=Heliothis virescens TaxID=7102 RepID=A0A2A4JV59_HELVI